MDRSDPVVPTTSNGWEPGGPWDAQSDTVKEIVDARDKAWGAEHFRLQFNANHPASAKLARQAKAADAALVQLARSTARPYPYLFEIRRAAAPTPAPR